MCIGLVPYRTVYTYWQYCKETFQEQLRGVDWESFYNFTDPEHCWDFIESKINNLIGEMCPLKHRTIKDRGDSWTTNEIIELVHDKELSWNTAMDTQHQNDIAEPKRLRNLSKSLLNKTRLPNLKVNEEERQYVNNYNYLGIKLDNKLSFELHANETQKIVAHKMYVLSKTRCYLTKKKSLIIYKSNILPYYDYGDALYMGENQTSLLKLQRLQNRGLRICLKVEARTNIRQLHRDSNVPFLKHRRTAHLLNLMYKRIEKGIQLAEPTRHTRLHDGVVMATKRANCRIFERSVYYRGANAWNNLTAELRNINNYEVFKAIQKQWMFTML